MLDDIDDGRYDEYGMQSENDEEKYDRDDLFSGRTLSVGVNLGVETGFSSALLSYHSY
jgi:hypothetical protein